MNNKCTENSKLWVFIYKLQKIKKQNIKLTPIERYNLCNYINGKPYDRVVLKSFI